MKIGCLEKVGWVQLIARGAVAGLFLLAIATKLFDPEQLLTPLRVGLGFSSMSAGVFFLVTVFILLVCVSLLLFWRGGLGLVLSGVFFAAGAMYAIVLNKQNYQGDCGCGVTVASGSANQLVVHAYQNSASAVLCLFLGFRARLEGDGHEESKNEED